ncbi:MAG: hypothetical protein HY904_16020 [Deltaproteobacteria bacterium]|nr:hypothetical protein [Deltaproteobacteria bacterium]
MNAAALLLVAAAAAPSPRAVLVDGVAALVEREVITRSDVDRAARVHLVRRGGDLGATRVSLEDGLRAAVMNLLVVEELVTQDCRRRQRFPETDEKVQAYVNDLKAALGGDDAYQEFLRRLQMPENDLLDLARREVRLDSALAEVMAGPAPTDGDLEATARADAEFRALLKDKGTEAARAVLARRRGEARAVAHIDSLRNRTPVKLVARWSDAPGP